MSELWLGRVWGMWESGGWEGAWGCGAARGWCHIPGLTRAGMQVGWTHVNLVKKLLEKKSGVTLVLKKIPLDIPSSPPSPRQQVSEPSASSTGPVPYWAVLGTRQRCSEVDSSHRADGP